MPKFTVHLYPEIRTVYDDIEAETMEQAIEVAAQRFEKIPSTMRQGYWEDTIPYALVDVDGDTEFEKTTSFKWQNGKWEVETWEERAAK